MGDDHGNQSSASTAAKPDVRQHHWPFGNMPPQPQVSQDNVAAIVKSLRDVQTANGIVTRPHAM